MGPMGRFDLPFDSQRLHFEFKLKYLGNILIVNSSPKIIILSEYHDFRNIKITKNYAYI